MIMLVRAGLLLGSARLVAAVDEALQLGVSDEAAVLHLLRMPPARPAPPMTLNEDLASFERPLPVMANYHLLLTDAPGGGS